MALESGIFTGDQSQILNELENFRELQSHCAHDLRSQVGAIAGLLSLLQDQGGTIDLKESVSFRAAVTSAQDALSFLDENVEALKPEYSVVWTVGLKSIDLTQLRGRLVKPCLVLNFEKISAWQEHINRYRPMAVFFKNSEMLGDNPAAWLYKLGPQLVRIFIFSNFQEPVTGVRPHSYTVLAEPAGLESVAEAIAQVLSVRA